MKKLLILLAALGGILLFSGCESKGWKTVDGVIVFDTPAREPGQKSVLRLKTWTARRWRRLRTATCVCPWPWELHRAGHARSRAVERFSPTHLDGVEIKALCDLYPERVDSAGDSRAPRRI